MRVLATVSRFTLSASAIAIGTAMASPAMAQTVAAAATQPAVPPEACRNIADSAAKQDCANRAQATVDPNANQGDLATSPSAGGAANAQASGANNRGIVVTGSRLHRDERTSPDPVQVIDPNVQNREGRLDTAEILQSSPLAQGSTQITSVLSTNFVVNGGEGVQNVDLRGLGPNRTLVLLNGRRAGPAGVRGGVAAFDLNVIPQDILQSVEVLKTGASSIYGSDAVAGVVNLITRKDIRGVQARITVTEPQRVGGGNYSISGIAGMGLGSRGHVMILGEYEKREALTRGERSFLGCETENVTSQATGQRSDPINPNTGQPYCGAFANDVIFLSDFAPYFTEGAVRTSSVLPFQPRAAAPRAGPSPQFSSIVRATISPSIWRRSRRAAPRSIRATRVFPFPTASTRLAPIRRMDLLSSISTTRRWIRIRSSRKPSATRSIVKAVTTSPTT